MSTEKDVRELAIRIGIDSVLKPIRMHINRFNDWCYTKNICKYCKTEYTRFDGCSCSFCHDEWCINCNTEEQNAKHIPCNEEYDRKAALEIEEIAKNPKPSLTIDAIRAFADICAREHAQRDQSPTRSSSKRCKHCERNFITMHDGKPIGLPGFCPDCSVLFRGPPR